MFKSITAKIDYPSWANERYKCLDMLDRVLDGTLYDHLQNDFYQEETFSGDYIPIQERRPSVRTGFASQVVGVVARKLFAGKHAPKITHDDENYAALIREVIARGSVYETMVSAMYLGSVGSVAVTFRLVEGSLKFDVWRAKNCYPVFGPAGELAALRVCYTVGGKELLGLGFKTDAKGKPVSTDDTYWFARVFTPSEEITCVPPLADDWNPVEYPWEALTPGVVIQHNLGFVPGVWITNMPGGVGVDGKSTFGEVVNNIVEMDYTLSQLGRGIRYSAAPQTVVIGDVESDQRRTPSTIIKLKAAYADEGQKFGAADAKLLEMVGNGTQVGLNYVQELRRITFEALAASIKKSELKTAMSGRAMEISDDAFYDLANLFRNSYGDGGLIPLMSKVMKALRMVGMLEVSIDEASITAFGLRWPKLYPSTPADDLQMVESLVMAVQNGLMDADTAKSYLYAQMDLEDFRVPTPPQTGSTEGDNVPTEGDATVPDDKYLEGMITDPRRPGPRGHSLPKQRVGGKQTTIY